MRLLIFLIILFLGLHLFFRAKVNPRPQTISHRGAGQLAPENTMAAFQVALDHRVDYIETDIQRSKDNVLFLLHDTSVDRTTNGKGEVTQLTWAEISQLDAGSHFAAAYAQERIPTLDQALATLKGPRVKFALELKSPTDYPNIENEVYALIQRHDLSQQVMIISLDDASLQNMHALAPQLSLGAIRWYPWQMPKLAGVQVVDFFWVGVLLDPTLVYRSHQRGYQVWVWTVNNPFLMRLLLWLGVDGITTDRPDVLNDVLGIAKNN